MTAKQEFVTDYENMNILELCKKYHLTPRTAQEYNKNFSRDIKKIICRGNSKAQYTDEEIIIAETI